MTHFAWCLISFVIAASLVAGDAYLHERHRLRESDAAVQAQVEAQMKALRPGNPHLNVDKQGRRFFDI